MAYAAIVLAAGLSTRFGGSKLSALLDGRPLLEHAVEIAGAAPVEQVVLVTRPGQRTPQARALEVVELASASLSQSLRAGLGAVGAENGAFIFLGDMPRVPPGMAARLAAAIGLGIAAFPVCNGLPGHPVLLSRRGFSLAEELTGDEGLGRVLRGRNDIVRVEVLEPGVLQDVDLASDIAALQRET